MGNNDVTVFLSGGDFGGATVTVPVGQEDFYVYSGDMINVYHHSKPGTADFLLSDQASNFTIPEEATSTELMWDVDRQTWTNVV